MFCLYGICYEVRIVYCQSSIKFIFILRLLTCTYYCLSLLQKANHQVRSHLQVSRLGNCPNCLVLQPKPQYKVPFVHLRRYLSILQDKMIWQRFSTLFCHQIPIPLGQWSVCSTIYRSFQSQRYLPSGILFRTKSFEI